MRFELINYCTKEHYSKVLSIYAKAEQNLSDPFRRINGYRLKTFMEPASKARAYIIGPSGAPKGAFVATHIDRPYKILDTGGVCIRQIDTPFTRVSSLAYTASNVYGALNSILEQFNGLVVFELNMKDQYLIKFLKTFGVPRITSKVTAFADVIGVFISSKVEVTLAIMDMVNILEEPSFSATNLQNSPVGSTSISDGALLHNLSIWKGENVLVPAIAERLEAMKSSPAFWVNHYSNYNEGKAWSALSLKGYGGLTDFIAKPEVMAQKWKKDNTEKLSWILKDTPLMQAFPEVQYICDQIPGIKQRVRFMNLAPNSGTLERHTDKSDKLLGIGIGKVARLHVPLITNKRVEFTVWNLEGTENRYHMGRGRLYYLDIYKPHKAVNHGTAERIHLVIDVVVGHELQEIITRAVLQEGG